MLTSASLIDTLRQTALLEPAQLDEAVQLAARFPDPRQLANELNRRGWLTAFQTRVLLSGQGEQLLLGRWILLDKLGEGGMGAVYKARDTRLNRIVAIKLLRPDRSTKPAVVRRFRREVEIASSLSHPNVVRAIDTENVDGSFIFEMEYVEGINLTQLVMKRGTLPVPMACDFIRQAALGLQHAHEQGLVHRDIKPSNLVVTRVLDAAVNGHEPSPHGLIKLLDMGLALILPREGEHAKSRLTLIGKVVGTTDFLAPEQARNSHEVDVRADLYSLGCTFYFLLTGRVPFPEGTPLEKMFKHQLDHPEPLEKLRPETPPVLVALIRKLMAKKPADRYQTPAEVAALLEPFTGTEDRSTPAAISVTPAPVRPPSAPALPVVVRPVAIPLPKPASGPAVPLAAVAAPMPKPTSAPALPVAAPVSVATVTALPAAAPVAITAVAAPAAAAEDSFTFGTGAQVPGPQRPGKAKRSPFAIWGILGGLLLVTLGIFLIVRYWPKEAPAIITEDPPTNPGERPNRAAWNLDKLNAADVREADRFPGLVAVLGEHRSAPPFPGRTIAVCLSPDGQFLAQLRDGKERTVSLWDLATRKERFTVRPKGEVTAIDFLTDGRTLAAWGPVGAWFWNTAGEMLGGFKPRGDGYLVSAVSRDGHGVVVAGKTYGVKVWDPLAVEERMTLKDVPNGAEVRAAWSPDGKTFAVYQQDQPAVHWWDVTTRKEKGSSSGFGAPVVSLAFSPDGQRIAALARDGSALVWDAAKGQEPAKSGQHTPVSHLAFSPDGAFVVAWGPTTLWLLPLADGKEVVLVDDKVFPVQFQSADFLPSGHTLATITSDAHVNLLDAATPDNAHFKRLRFPYPVHAAAFSTDGRHLITANGDGTLYVLRLSPAGK